jgi:hypothetical protein
MKARNISVTFNVDVYDSRPWFQIPTAVAKLLDLKSGDVIAVSISTPQGELRYHGLANMGSGKEIYRSYVSTRLKKGEEIRVTVARPPKDVVGLVPQSKKKPPAKRKAR